MVYFLYVLSCLLDALFLLIYTFTVSLPNKKKNEGSSEELYLRDGRAPSGKKMVGVFSIVQVR